MSKTLKGFFCNFFLLTPCFRTPRRRFSTEELNHNKTKNKPAYMGIPGNTSKTGIQHLHEKPDGQEYNSRQFDNFNEDDDE